jgi:prophage regulatory protein
MYPLLTTANKRQGVIKMGTTILRRPAVLQARGKAKSSLYDDVKAGLFTKPVKIGARAVGWPATEVDAIIAATIAGNTAGEIRLLVISLEELRQEGRWGGRK